MREPKYRAWLKTATPQGMVEVELIDFEQREIMSIEGVYGWCRRSFDDIELMEYTGLKDKNGKESYHSDIVKRNNEEIVEIIYDSNRGWFAYKTDGLATPLGECILFSSDMGRHIDGEIIGNRYKNPKLLEKVK